RISWKAFVEHGRDGGEHGRLGGGFRELYRKPFGDRQPGRVRLLRCQGESRHFFLLKSLFQTAARTSPDRGSCKTTAALMSFLAPAHTPSTRVACSLRTLGMVFLQFVLPRGVDKEPGARRCGHGRQ